MVSSAGSRLSCRAWLDSRDFAILAGAEVASRPVKQQPRAGRCKGKCVKRAPYEQHSNADTCVISIALEEADAGCPAIRYLIMMDGHYSLAERGRAQGSPGPVAGIRAN